MEQFVEPPQGSRVLPSHHAVYANIERSWRYATLLLAEEEINAVRLKVLGDDLERALDDIRNFSSNDVNADWIRALVALVRATIDRVREVESALLEE
jgi:hypothetical protein